MSIGAEPFPFAEAEEAPPDLERRRHLARTSLHEYAPGMLQRRGAYWVDPSGALYEKPVGTATLPDGTPVLGSAVAFTVMDGRLVYLARPRGGRPRTVEELEARDRAREAERQAKAERIDRELRAQAVEPVTLADLHGRGTEGLPSVRAAAETVLRYGSLDVTEDARLVVSVPANLRRHKDYRDAALVLYTAEPLLLSWLGKKTRKVHELPDGQVLPSGAVAP